jgi:plastocyanin
MRKGMWSAAALVTILSGAVAFLLGPTVQAADGRVEMVDLAFEPANIDVPVNTPVVFHNGSGSLQHDAKAENNSFATPMIDPGKEHSVTAKGAPGDVIAYFCTVEGHKSAGMKGTIRLVAAGATPSATTPTTAATTTTTAKPAPGQATTTTTAKAGAGASSSTTTTAAPAANGATTTTLTPAVTPTSGPDTAGESTTTTAAGGGEEAAADHASEGGEKKEKKKNSPIGIAFASVSTLLLAAVAGKLLASKP